MVSQTPEENNQTDDISSMPMILWNSLQNQEESKLSRMRFSFIIIEFFKIFP